MTCYQAGPKYSILSGEAARVELVQVMKILHRIAQNVRGRAYRLATSKLNESTVRRIERAVGTVRNRVRLARWVLTGRELALLAVEDNWPVTKRQMLVAHEKLSMDLRTLRAQVDAVARRVGNSEVQQVRIVRKKPKGKAVQVDADMPTVLT